MKKVLFILLLVTVSVSYACNKQANTTAGPTIDTALLLGKWKIAKGEIYVNGKLEETDDLKIGSCTYNYYEFLEKNVKNEVQYDEEDCSSKAFPGKWTFDKNTNIITMTDDGDTTELKLLVVSLNKNTLKIELLADEENTENTKYIMYLSK